MNKIIKSIYKGMIGPKTEFFLLKFVIMHKRKKHKQWDLLRKIRIIDYDKYDKKLRKPNGI